MALAAGCGSSSPSGDPPPGDVDSGPETAPLDTGISPADGGSDAADARPDAPDAGLGYCRSLTPKPKFCDDFDDGDLTNDWDQATAIGGSVMDLDDSSWRSSPFSFHVLTKALPAASSGNVLLRKTVLGNVGQARLAFSAFFPTVTLTKGAIAIATLDVSLNHFFTLNLRDQDGTAPAASLEEYVGGTFTRHLLTRLPPAGAWTRIVIDLDFVNGRANVSFDASKALDAEPITALVGTETTVRLGGVYVEGPSDVFEARFDDVVIDF